MHALLIKQRDDAQRRMVAKGVDAAAIAWTLSKMHRDGDRWWQQERATVVAEIRRLLEAGNCSFPAGA